MVTILTVALSLSFGIAHAQDAEQCKPATLTGYLSAEGKAERQGSFQLQPISAASRELMSELRFTCVTKLKDGVSKDAVAHAGCVKANSETACTVGNSGIEETLFAYSAIQQKYDSDRGVIDFRQTCSVMDLRVACVPVDPAIAVSTDWTNSFPVGSTAEPEEQSSPAHPAR